MSEIEESAENILNSIPGLEAEDMKPYLQSALQVVTFKIIHEESDLKVPAKRTNSFKPEMAHQVFGENEVIFGYKHLSITLNYHHNSAQCLVEIGYTGKYESATNGSSSSKNSPPQLEPDDISKSLESWLPEKYYKDVSEFEQFVKEDVHDTIFGDLLLEYKANEKTYKFMYCDTTDEEFREFHQRFESFLVWFIDGANAIDLTDPRWLVFYAYEEEIDKNGKIQRSPVGVCTAYKFYLGLNSIRPRISQFFVLPTHQRRGIGTLLYKAVFKYLKSIPEVVDITVEEPTDIFQRIRDVSDGICIYEDLEQNGLNASLENYHRMKDLMKNHKIGKKQCQRILDVLSYLQAEKLGCKNDFNKQIRKRIETDMTKESRGSKRMCNADRVGIAVENANLNERIDDVFQRYLESLDWPMKRLSNYLSTKKNGK